jgi:hypothetical protein
MTMQQTFMAMDAIELAIRRVSDRLKSRTPWDMAVTEALDELAAEIGEIRSRATPTHSNGVGSPE